MSDKYIGKYDNIFKELLEKRAEKRELEKLRTVSEYDKFINRINDDVIMNSDIGSSWDSFEKEAFTDEEIKASDERVKELSKEIEEKAFKLLDEQLEKYNIPNKPSKDGVARIDGMTVDEYFEKVGLW